MKELVSMFIEKINEMDSWPDGGVWKYMLSWSIFESIKDSLRYIGFVEVEDGVFILERNNRKIIVYRDSIWNEC